MMGGTNTGPVEPRNQRTANRAADLKSAYAKLEAKLAAAPDDPRADAWRQRLAEYRASLDTIAAVGLERVRGRDALLVDVPPAPHKGRAH